MKVWQWAALAWLALTPVLPLARATPGQLAWARDRWLVGLAGVALLWLLSVEPALAIVAAAALAQWRGPAQMPAVVTWAAVVGAWFAAASVPARSAAYVFGWATALFAVSCLWQWAGGERVVGALGHRTLTGAALALALPFAWAVAPSAAIPGLVALALTESWLAWIAGAVALGCLAPWTLCVSGALAAVWLVPVVRVARLDVTYEGPGEYSWLQAVGHRGASVDSLRARRASARELLRHLSWRGLGPGAVQRITARAGVFAGHAHCDPLEYVVEYGALGALALAAVAWRLAPHLRLGDPWTAAVLAGTVLACGSYPMRVAPVGGLWWAACAVLAAR